MVNVVYQPPAGEPERTSTLGYDFVAGEGVDIDETDEGNHKLLRKLDGHPHFDVGGKPKRQRTKRLSADELAARAKADKEAQERAEAQASGLTGAEKARRAESTDAGEASDE